MLHIRNNSTADGLFEGSTASPLFRMFRCLEQENITTSLSINFNICRVYKIRKVLKSKNEKSCKLKNALKSQ